MWELPPFPSLTGMVDIAESEAGLKWEAEASLGPLLILDTETSLATDSLNEAEGRMQERSPGGELADCWFPFPPQCLLH